MGGGVSTTCKFVNKFVLLLLLIAINFKISKADCNDYVYFSSTNFNNPITVCQNTSTDLFADNCPINPTSTSYIQWHSIFGGNDVMFASNIANNAANSNYQNYTFTSIGQYQIYYEIGNMVAGVFVPSGGVSFGNYLTVNVVNEIPTGNFVSPFNLCENSTLIQFNYSGTPGIIDSTLSTIDLGDGNGPQVLNSFIFDQLTGLGLNTYYSASNTAYTVTLVLVNVCGSASFTQSYMVYDQIPITTNDVSICEGTQSVNLSANLPNGATVEWFSNGNSIGTGNPLTLNPAPISTATYSATASLAGGCSNSANLTVTVILEQTIQIEGPPTNCNWRNAVYNILNPEPGVIYTWNITNGYPSVATGSTVNITWDQNNLSQGGTIEISAVGFPCLLTNIINIEPCCVSNEVATLIIDGESDNNPNTNQILLSHYFPNPNGTTLIGPQFLYGGNSYSSLVFGGAVVVDIDFTISSDIIVDMLPQASINVIAGKTLTIENGTVLKAACKEMWDGIYLSGPSNLSATNIPKLKVFNGVTIQDMENGIVCNNNALYEIGNNQAAVSLNKNYKNITVTGFSNNSFNAVQPSFVKNCRFTCEASQYTQPDDYLISPHSNQITFYGMSIFKVNNISIGAAIAQQSNLFKNMNYGIISSNANINVYNNFFENITDFGVNEECNCRNSAAICAEGRTLAFGFPWQTVVPSNTATIGGLGLNQQNSFLNCNVGIQFTRYMNGNIIDNSFDHISFYGINANNHAPLSSNSCFLNIEENEFHDIQVAHNYIVNYTSVPKLIKNNYYNQNTQNLTTIFASAIVVEDATNSVTGLNINDNNINMVQYGISCKNQNKAVINDNTIALSTVDPYVNDNDRSHGIKIDHCNSAIISDNLISADNRDFWWTHGITADYSDNAYIYCNHTYKTGHGIVWSGSYSNPRIYNNNMHRNAAGLTINWASFGQQITYAGNNGPAPMYADNIWVGPYGNYYHTKVFTCPSCPPIGIMYARPQQGTPYLPNPFYAFSDQLQMELKPDNLTPSAGTLQWINAEENNHFCNLQSAQSTLDNIPVTSNNLLATANPSTPLQETFDSYWWEIYQKYLKLSGDTLLDTEVVNWLDSMENTAIGQLVKVSSAINPKTNDYTSIALLQSQNDLIVALTQQESVFKTANSLWLQALIFQNDSSYSGYPPSSFDFEMVKSLSWECARTHGPGVYEMRVLANLLDSKIVNYYNTCELVYYESPNRAVNASEQAYLDDESHDYDFLNSREKADIVNSFNVYPNPSTGSFNIDVEQINSSQIVIKVYNSLGQQIETMVQVINEKTVSVDINKQAAGLYTIELLLNQKIIGRGKLSITE